MGLRKQEVRILLRDYMNILPPGPQEAFVPIGTGGGQQASWPLTPESEMRIDKGTDVGYTYGKLDEALNRLDDERPDLYAVILKIYLHPEAGHMDSEHLRLKAKTYKHMQALVDAHDEAIDLLSEYLEGEDLHVRWPQKAPGPQPGQDMDERHKTLFATFLRNIEQGIPYRQSVRNAAFKGEYSARHAERIIKPRWVKYNEES